MLLRGSLFCECLWRLLWTQRLHLFYILINHFFYNRIYILYIMFHIHEAFEKTSGCDSLRHLYFYSKTLTKCLLTHSAKEWHTFLRRKWKCSLCDRRKRVYLLSVSRSCVYLNSGKNYPYASSEQGRLCTVYCFVTWYSRYLKKKKKSLK